MTKFDQFLADLGPYRTLSGLIDAHTLPVPTPLDWGDNGTMFFGESVCIASKLEGADGPSLPLDVIKTYHPYFIVPGLLRRRQNDTDIDGPDNMLGVLAASKVTGVTQYARDIFWYGIKHFGFFNQPNPGSPFYPGTHKIDGEAFLWRQLQLIAATISAARFNRLVKILFFPLYFYTALVILYAGLVRAAPSQDLDSRRLAWLLIQCVGDDSILCWLASKVWYHGLRKDYPLSTWGQSMRGVASYFYQQDPKHPFITYWMD